MTTELRWCCRDFQDLYQRRHDLGLFIAALPPLPTDPSPVRFVLAFRAGSMEDVARLMTSRAKARMRVTFQHQTPVFCCPWCGTRLVKFYGAVAGLLIDLEIARELG